MLPMRCPTCGLENPPSAIRCDCGCNLEDTEFQAELLKYIVANRGDSALNEFVTLATTALKQSDEAYKTALTPFQDILDPSRLSVKQNRLSMNSSLGPGPRYDKVYSADISHEALGQREVFEGKDLEAVWKKVFQRTRQWNEIWVKQLAQEGFAILRRLLVSSLERSCDFGWERLRFNGEFTVPSPIKPEIGSPPLPVTPLPRPDPDSSPYQPKLTVLDRAFPSRKELKLKETRARFESEMQAWKEESRKLALQHEAALKAYAAKRQEVERAYQNQVIEWESEKESFYADLNRKNEAVDTFRRDYESKHPGAIELYCGFVLTLLDYRLRQVLRGIDVVTNREGPNPIEALGISGKLTLALQILGHETAFNQETEVLIVNCHLPAPKDLPTIAGVKFIPLTETFELKELSELEQTRLYDDVIYQITLRSISDLFRSDQVGAVATIVFNGIVTSVDKSTGNEVTACIVSVQVSKEAFQSINLSAVDPKECFRKLKGVGSSKLHSITPIAPIMELRRDDSRFVAPHAVADKLNEGHNLAAMDWEDFEHLIREIFEKEFSTVGGEVKVTQASRDRGVDAVVFDPDPIRGGKIVIQAKRYAFTVDVAAVRDLYGTILNEGAIKGILVTTSDYGPDAYEFAKGKPITLLSGSNLLHLLQKHGVKAHIDLVEARKLTTAKPARTA
jgi:restriction system protein